MPTTTAQPTVPSRPRKPRPKKPDAPCARINGGWVLLTDLVKWKNSWPSVKCGKCPKAAYGLFAITTGMAYGMEKKTIFVTLCSRCALGNKLDPRKRPGIKIVFEIVASEELLEAEALVDAALGAVPRLDNPVNWFVTRERYDDDFNRHVKMVGVTEKLVSTEAISFARVRWGHEHPYSLVLTRFPDPKQPEAVS